MANKKYTILLVMLFAMQIASFAQTASWDWKDSSVVPANSVSQYHEFLQNVTPFPTKPRNAWEWSAGLGYSSVTNDAKSSQGIGWSASLRKALGNTTSYRIGYYGSYNPGKGVSYDYSGVSTATSPAQGKYTTPDFRNFSHNFSTDLIVSLNTFSNYRGDPTSNLYVFGGVGVTLSDTKIKVAGSDEFVHVKFPQKYYLGVVGKNKNTYAFTTFDFGLGYAYKINKKFNIAIEQRLTSPVKKVGYVCGYNSQTGTKNMYYFTAIKFNFNIIK